MNLKFKEIFYLTLSAICLNCGTACSGTYVRSPSSNEESVRTNRSQGHQNVVSSDNHLSEKTASSGAIFLAQPPDSVLGEGWRDPRGLIWYDIVRDEKGSPLKMNHSGAVQHCESHNARLPSMFDIRGLEEWFSIRISETAKRYSPQIFPNLDRPFWISELSHNQKDSYLFFADKDDIFDLGVQYKAFVRCVRQFQ